MTECKICGSVRTRHYCHKETAEYAACRDCGALFQHPTPSPESMVSYAEAEYASGLYREYVQARAMKLDHFRYRFQSLQSRVRPGRLLDLGCSCGYLLEIASAAGYDVHGLEFSKGAIAAADPSIRARILCSGIDCLAGEQEYDVITAFDLIEHVEDPQDFLQRARRLLIPGGTLVLSTPDSEHFLRYFMGRRWPMLQPMQHLTIFSRRALRLALEKAGFAAVTFEVARKTLSYEYLVNQLPTLAPALHAGLHTLGSMLPGTLMRKFWHVNIGEFLAIATRPDRDGGVK